MSIILGKWDARTEDFIGERYEPPALDHSRLGVLCKMCGGPMPLGRRGESCSRRCSQGLYQHRAKQAAREDKIPHAHVCELCEARCGMHRYLCVGCAGQLGLIGSYEERQMSLLSKRESKPEERARGVA